VAIYCEYGDDPMGSGIMELVSVYTRVSCPCSFEIN
jgi:hypothetical protein